MQQKALKVRCKRCGLTIFELQEVDGKPAIIFKARHHGEVHTSSFGLEELARYLTKGRLRVILDTGEAVELPETTE